MKVSPPSLRLLSWTFFAAFVLTVPIFFFLLVVGATVPLASVITVAIRSLVAPLQGYAFESIWVGMGIIHTGVYSLVFWWLSRLLAWLIGKVPSPAMQWASYVAVLLGAAWIAVLAPYGAGGHGPSTNYSWLETFTKLNGG